MNNVAELLLHIAAKYNINLQEEARELKAIQPTLLDTIMGCCDVIGADYYKLISKTRKREIVQQRQCIMAAIYQTKKHPNKKIGIEFGGRHWSTVIHARHTVDDMLFCNDLEFKEYMEKLGVYLDGMNSMPYQATL